jgi:hypothetical protein
MKHASLFSGIGGFDLAAEWVGWENIFHCEWNPFGQQVLKHHFPNSISYNDITKTDFKIHANKIDVLTGGFPCQPYSSAGKRLGKADERHLFPEMLRCIKEVKPKWIIGENVRGLVSWGGGWYSTKCTMTWKAKAMKSNRFLFLLQVSMHHTKDIEFSLSDLKTMMIKTPTASDKNGGCTRGNPKMQMGSSLVNQMHHICKTQRGKTSQLNTRFVMETMGFPKNWTELPFQNGEANQLKQQETQ